MGYIEVSVMMSYVPEDNTILEGQLKKVEGFIKINRMVNGQKLYKRDELPFVQTDEGDNYYGLERVKHFVERELKRKQKMMI